MTGTASTLDGEADLQFESRDSTLIQNMSILPSTPSGGFISNIDSSKLLSSSNYPSAPYYTGETIQARIVNGPNVGGVGNIRYGQLCYWCNVSGVWGFDMVDGGPSGINTCMLAIALADGNIGDNIVFLLKGFVSTGYVNLGSSREGAPLYIQKANFGYMCESGAWSGSVGVDIWRSIGYLVSTGANTGGTLEVIRFDPSSDYTI